LFLIIYISTTIVNTTNDKEKLEGASLILFSLKLNHNVCKAAPTDGATIVDSSKAFVADNAYMERLHTTYIKSKKELVVSDLQTCLPSRSTNAI
jgi:hypothetical protein